MTSLDPAATAAPIRPLVQRFVPVLYGVTLFASALLLFVVQPMFAKIVSAPRRGTVGLVGGHGVLSGRAARRLRLRASP